MKGHGGKITAYSEVGKGSVFKVCLLAQTGITTEGKEQKPVLLPRGQGELILVVDDESSILNITKQTLEIFGYETLIAEDGAQATGIFASHQERIALVLTDMMMPVMDGPALIAAIRRINPRVPIIAASGLNANGNVARAAKTGVKHFLAKPYSAEKMLLLVRAVLSESGGEDEL